MATGVEKLKVESREEWEVEMETKERARKSMRFTETIAILREIRENERVVW